MWKILIEALNWYGVAILSTHTPLLKCKYMAVMFRLGSVQLLKEPENHIAKGHAAHHTAARPWSLTSGFPVGDREQT